MEKSRKELFDQIIRDCLNEIYMAAQPSITFDELEILASRMPDQNLIYKFYISEEELKDIKESYIYAYNIRESWNDNVDLVLDYLINGGTKDSYVTSSEGYLYRGYEKTPKLADVIGDTNAQKVVELIKTCQDFYKFDVELNKFEFNISNYCPCSDYEQVKEYWAKYGVKIYKRVYNEDTDQYENEEY